MDIFTGSILPLTPQEDGCIGFNFVNAMLLEEAKAILKHSILADTGAVDIAGAIVDLAAQRRMRSEWCDSVWTDPAIPPLDLRSYNDLPLPVQVNDGEDAHPMPEELPVLELAEHLPSSKLYQCSRCMSFIVPRQILQHWSKIFTFYTWMPFLLLILIKLA